MRTAERSGCRFCPVKFYHCLLGNHEQMLLEVLDIAQVLESRADLALQWRVCDRNQLQAKPPFLHNWMRLLPTYLDLGDVWLSCRC